MLTVFLLSIALSLDAFAVSFAHGLQKTRIPFLSKLVICACSILYFGFSAWFGKWLAGFFSPQTASVVGIALMAAVCAYMLLGQFLPKREKKRAQNSRTLLDITIKSLRLSIRIIRNPMACDLDGSQTITAGEALLLGTAVSVDSVNVGLGFSLMGGISPWAPLAVGGCQFLFVLLGNSLGLRCSGARFRFAGSLPYISICIMFLLLCLRLFSLFA